VTPEHDTPVSDNVAPFPTRIRPRLTVSPGACPARADLSLAEGASAGLARISGGGALEELVVLAAAAALVVAGAEDVTEPAVAVADPAGTAVCHVDLATVGTVSDLVLAVDAALRGGGRTSKGGDGQSAGVLVRSGRVEAPVTRAAVEIVLSDGQLHATADPRVGEEWFLETLLRAVDDVLAAFAEPALQLSTLRGAAVRDIEQATRFGWNEFDHSPPMTTLTAPIQAAAQRHPERPAVVADGLTLTYGELWAAALGVAGRLMALGLGPGHRIAVLTGKSVHAVPAILGTLLARTAYVPLDAESPAGRLADILADACCSATIVAEGLGYLLPARELLGRVVDLGTVTAREHGAPTATPGPSPDDLAYVIYTSGSTGTPKGVAVRHRAIASYVAWKLRYHGLDGDTRLLQIPSLAFDSSVSDIFSVLAGGGLIVLATAHRLLPRQLADLVRQYEITHVTLVPSLYRVTLGELAGAASLRLVTVAGEAMPAELVRRHSSKFPQVRLVNEYGPTENAVGATAFDHGTDAGPGYPIGRPLPNTVVTVVGTDGRRRPVGFVGELRLAGHGLADGYHGRPELTAAGFKVDPDVPGGRCYRTGDLGWWRPDGILEFAGRADDQVKIRGNRVELGEVEAVLGRIAGVAAVVVAVVEAADGSPALVAYVEAPGLTAAQLRAAATEALPRAMLPARFELVGTMPRLVSGKPDRAALVRRDGVVAPARGVAALVRAARADGMAGPQSDRP
jgi:amino acid adenylation domain-containing protein